ncbi:protein SODIUM POTASSIUM ROOT DEFECTIVE 2 [Vigna radiata var. radiata]|uniref:Protein SODIUM POTASSIUM ROOT DEFECTIVE 2 n=1 Tax=Vigna radiata var. radiata TaxID=3916 RepID=A0A1S3TNK4_VIGRR|nr:protein SODIUM POTASSIUM ROOT DEFECTIVE 2 [Vigna radiata var. radiata]
MKGIDIFCASQASTAICLSMDEPSSSISNTTQFGGRAIDRHNPIITDPRRTPSRDFIVPSSSPKPLHDHLPKPKKNSTSKPSVQKKKNPTKGLDQKKKSSMEKLTEHITNNYSSKPIDSILRRSWVRPPTDLITPPGSSRYLLGDMPSFHAGSSLYDPVLALTNVDKDKAQVLHHDETIHSSKPSSSSSLPKSAPSDQVVVLRVSLHCKGCEGKVRKHLSRMRGVTSFNIDFAAKKVTVVGDVTPLSVLASISKVKNAQFWPEPASVVGSGYAETKKTNFI